MASFAFDERESDGPLHVAMSPHCAIAVETSAAHVALLQRSGGTASGPRSAEGFARRGHGRERGDVGEQRNDPISRRTRTRAPSAILKTPLRGPPSRRPPHSDDRESQSCRHVRVRIRAPPPPRRRGTGGPRSAQLRHHAGEKRRTVLAPRGGPAGRARDVRRLGAADSRPHRRWQVRGRLDRASVRNLRARSAATRVSRPRCVSSEAMGPTSMLSMTSSGGTSSAASRRAAR
jgi:hypothetical protein